jgi:hypothetical protein
MIRLSSDIIIIVEIGIPPDLAIDELLIYMLPKLGQEFEQI